MITTQQQAIRNAEAAGESYMDRFLDNLTDYDETVPLNLALRQSYEKKNNFLVFEMGASWVINASTPTFYPDGPIVGYLKGYFPTVQIDDEYNLIVTVPNPANTLDDGDYVAKKFDDALAWLPKWQKVNKLFIAYEEAKEALEMAQQALIQLPKAS